MSENGPTSAASFEQTWKCRRCKCHVELQKEDRWSTIFPISHPKPHLLKITWTVCPNLNCQEVTLVAKLFRKNEEGPDFAKTKQIHHWVLLPQRKAVPFPDYIPKHLIRDYQEAYAIQTVSPNGSAMLARRCLHGIIQDIWKTKPARLCDEIKAIREKISPSAWEAIDAVRKFGNIGAHSGPQGETVQVTAKEARLLVNLLERLFTDWYVARENCRKPLEELCKAAKLKTRLTSPVTER